MSQVAATEVCANFLSASSTSSASGSGSVSPSAGGRQTRISWEVNYIQEFHLSIQRQGLEIAWPDTKILRCEEEHLIDLTFPLFFQNWISTQGVTERGIDPNFKAASYLRS